MKKNNRLRKKSKINATKIIIVTGSIGMGKSTTLSLFRHLGYPYFDADFSARKVVESDTNGYKMVKENFPSVIKDNKIDRKALGKIVFSNANALRKLEKIIHPLIRKERERFIKSHRVKRSKAIVLDIPLFLEKKEESSHLNIFVVTAPSFIQRQRVIRRKGMTNDRFINILNSQMPDIIKRQKSTQIIQSGLGKRFVLNKIKFLKTKIR